MARLTTGECFNLSDTEFAVVPCQERHDDEVYYRYVAPRGPREEDDASSKCDAHLTDYVGSRSSAAFFDWPITPNQPEWAAGDHVVVCALGRIDGRQITGSARQTH